MVQVMRSPGSKVCGGIEPQVTREIEPLGYEEFCAVLESGDHLGYYRTKSGLQIITLPRATLICDGDECTISKVIGTNMDAFFEAQLQALESIAA